MSQPELSPLDGSAETLRQRTRAAESGSDQDHPDVPVSDSDEDPSSKPKLEGLAKLPQGTDHEPALIACLLPGLTPRWRNWVVRGVFTWLMIGFFCLIIWAGFWALIATVIVVQVWCFYEIITIGYMAYRVDNLPWFRSISWWFLITSNYFFYGESLIADYFGHIFKQSWVLRSLLDYHLFLSFVMYSIGFVWFVLALKKRYYMRQFSLFGLTHVALFIIVSQSYTIINNIFEGMIWFIVPVSMVIINDVMAYMFGFFIGKTPLIALSPKKTWEGAIGGGVSTVILGMLLSYVLCSAPSLTCAVPATRYAPNGTTCDRVSPIFLLTEYQLPWGLARVASVLTGSATFATYPFVFHSVPMALSASILGPFGGLFASGFKRAFKIKDFGDVIPGHGGMLDRFDCQFVMATFVFVYIRTFVWQYNSQELIKQVLMLPPDQRVHLYRRLEDSLVATGLI